MVAIYVLAASPVNYLVFYSQPKNYILSLIISLAGLLLLSPLAFGYLEIILRILNGGRVQLSDLFAPYRNPGIFKTLALLTFISQGSKCVFSLLASSAGAAYMKFMSFDLYLFYALMRLLFYTAPFICRFMFGPAMVDLATHKKKTAREVLSNAFNKLRGKRIFLLKLSACLFLCDFVFLLIDTNIQVLNAGALYKTVMFEVFSLVWWVALGPFVMLCDCIFYKSVLEDDNRN